MSSVSAAPPLSHHDGDSSIGKYRFIASLGHGGMADVYLAVVPGPAGFNKLQVVKRLRRDYVEDPDHVEMFLDEARLAARLSHPNVVQTYEVSESDGEYFMAMEYLEGQPFNRIISRAKKDPPPPGLLFRIVADALAGLHYAHELTDYDGTPLHIVHRDASPHNVLVTYDGHTKILDFGIAKSEVRSGETRTGIVKGKVAYMAPEQARCKPLDRRADVFVLGIVLWEIATGRKLWDKASDIEVLHRLATGEYPRVHDVNPNAPEEIDRICAKAMARDPAERYATAAEMRADILAYLDQARLRTSSEDVGRYVTTAFGDKRADIRKVIDQQISKLKAQQSGERMAIPDVAGPPDAAPDSLSIPNLGGSGRHSLNGSGSNPKSLTGSNARIPGTNSLPPAALPSQGQEATMQVAAAPASNRGSMILGAAIVLAAAMGAFVFMKSRAPGPNAAPSSAEATQTEAAPQPAPSAAPVATAAVAPTNTPEGTAMVEIKVRAIPAQAEIFLDGAHLPTNPFTGKFPADGASHRVHAEARDHRSAAQIVTFDKDAKLELVLEPKSGAAQATPTTTSDDPPEEPAATPTPPPSPAPAATSTRAKRKLGDADPFNTAAPAATTTGKKRSLGDGQNPW
ncbi:serine/threonine protein kinase [Polyangium mundeleinium]|uniref:Serine/threonine-protein kinase n=1 Tax=Polyangium mundeleinium TaxID=2995306 RepID=A0ABT5EVB9_9BACT|nr:serine/threonine-protein kinase [Polyangium mundeleinium]MDC0745775.1 serine/threonine-protein kinase [Polyangium mundeleinium]